MTHASEISESSTRLLLFTDNFELGGSQSQLVQLANALERFSEYEVHVGCVRKKGALLSRLEVPEERVHEFWLRRFYGPGGLRQIFRLARWLLAERVDLVHAQDFYAGVMCAAAAGPLPRCKLIVSRRYERLTDRAIHQWGERWCYRLADAVVVNSGNVAESLVRERLASRGKLVVIPNGIDPSRFSSLRHCDDRGSEAPRGPQVGIVASLCADKGHEMLLEAAARLARKWPNLVLTLVGDGELRDELARQADRLGLTTRVRMVGAQEDVRPWLAEFDVAVLSSHREGLPNALLEYMAAGCPVVATRVGGIPEVVRHEREALLVAPGDPEGLAMAIDTMLADGRLRADLAEAGQRRAAEFDLERMVSRTKRLYESLLGDSTAQAVGASSDTATPSGLADVRN